MFRIPDKRFIYNIVGLVIILSIYLGYCFFYEHRPPEKETGMSQVQAESEAGINTAAHNAQVPLSATQTKEVVTQIREIHTTEQVPMYVVQSNGATVSQDVEQAREDNKADFAVVTDHNHPDEEVKLDKDAKVELNQYNVQAYKPILRTVEYGTDKVLTFSISKKISKNGNYVGVGAGYDFDDKRAIARISYTW